jgi:hypothetical protein
MGIFERDKLPLVANVEQVRVAVLGTFILVDLHVAELRNRSNGRRKDPENIGGRNGTTP